MHTVKFHRLPNGLRVVTVSRPYLHSATVRITLPTGSAHDPPSLAGLAHFFEHTTFRGTPTRPHGPDEAFESIGVNANACTSRYNTTFYATGATGVLAESAAILHDCLTAPTFTAAADERKAILAELVGHGRHDGVSIAPENVAHRLLYGQKHRLARDIVGTDASVKRITARHLREHAASAVNARGRIVVAGPLDHGQLLAATAPFASLAAAERRPVPAPALRDERLLFVNDSEGEATAIVAWPTNGSRDAATFALWRLHWILTDGMRSRFYKRLRTELGLVYGAKTYCEESTDFGVMWVELGVAPALAARVVTATLDVLREVTESVTDAEVDVVRRNARRYNETCDDDVGSLADAYDSDTMDDPPLTLDGMLAAGDGLTATDLRDAARRMFAPENIRVSVIGRLSRAMRSDVEKVVRGRLC